ncbi:hypothetical protein FACS189430_08940 [Bacteroidia bacterium]|nr:hypothetical protein FACS189430_08940 [Bacteroidia bacterium]
MFAEKITELEVGIAAYFVGDVAIGQLIGQSGDAIAAKGKFGLSGSEKGKKKKAPPPTPPHKGG